MLALVSNVPKKHRVVYEECHRFFNGKPGEVVTVQQSVTSVRQKYPDGEEIYLQIMSAGFPSLTGDRSFVYVASDRELTSQKILDATKTICDVRFRKNLSHFTNGKIKPQ